MAEQDHRNKVRGVTRYVMRVVPNTGANPNKKSEKLSTLVLGIPGLEIPCGHNPMIPSGHPSLAVVQSGQRVYMSCTQCPPDSEMVQGIIQNAIRGTAGREPEREVPPRGIGDTSGPGVEGVEGMGTSKPNPDERTRTNRRRTALAHLRGTSNPSRRKRTRG